MKTYFTYAGDGYVQNGAYTVSKQYKPGFAHIQGAGQILERDGAIPLQPYPDYFGLEYMQFMKPDDGETIGYDRASYAASTPVYVKEIQVPRVVRATLFHMYTTNGTRESCDLMLFEGTPAQFVNRAGQRIDEQFYTRQEYLDEFGDTGYNRFGKVLPRKTSKAPVDDLRAITGEFTEKDGTVLTSATIFVSPAWLHNSLPFFDEVYVQADNLLEKNTLLDPSQTLLSNRLLRWQGGIVSENRAFINFQDHTNGVDFAARTGNNPTGATRLDVKLSENGVEFEGTEMYNVTNYRRN